MKKTFLGLPVYEGRFPHYTMVLFNFGMILLFMTLPTLLTLVVLGRFQNPANKPTFGTYIICLLIAIVFQQIVRVLTNLHVKASYSHWTNQVFIGVLAIVGYFIVTQA